MSRSERLRRRAGQRAMTGGEERLARPMGREMKPETAHTPADAARDFEQLEADGPDGRRRQGRSREDTASEVGEQQQGDAVELQSDGVGAEPMTAEAIGVDVQFEFFDPILRRAAIVVPRDEIGGVAAAVGDHEAHVEALRGDVDLDQDASRMRPRLRAMPKARAEVHGPTRAIVPRLRLGDASATRALKTRLVPMPST